MAKKEKVGVVGLVRGLPTMLRPDALAPPNKDWTFANTIEWVASHLGDTNEQLFKLMEDAAIPEQRAWTLLLSYIDDWPTFYEKFYGKQAGKEKGMEAAASKRGGAAGSEKASERNNDLTELIDRIMVEYAPQ